MKKVIFVCDRCGWQMTEPWVTIPIETGERHLCEFCTEKILAALLELKGPKEEEPKEEKPKRKRIDQGKVLALAKAGWTVAKIADEMDCSVQSVYNALNALNALKKEAEE